MNAAHKSYQYRLVFTDMLNQTSYGGHYYTFDMAIFDGRLMIAAGRRSSFKIVRISDKVVLAQSY